MSTSDLIKTLSELSEEELNAVRYLLDLPFHLSAGEPEKEPEAVIERAKNG